MAEGARDPTGRLAEAVEAYLAFLERRKQGKAEPEEEFLLRHPEARDLLEALLRDRSRDNATAETETPALKPGEEAAGFRIHRRLGSGGMGVVYEAESLQSGRRVALKVISPELRASEEAMERFRREARLAASISHPRCVYVYGAHEVAGLPAISMELVEGETLQERLRRDGSLAIGTAVRWTMDILEGLEAAHRAGVTHRDVKPSNGFLGPDGRVKVGDFGLARTLRPDTQLTQSGSFLGSPTFASPEQVRGHEVDHRTDIYSTGATLYALLTGRSPFDGDGLGETLARVLSEPPVPPRDLRPEIPVELERACLRAMAKEPARRFASAEDFHEALQPFAPEEPVPARLGARVLAYIGDAVVLQILLTPILFGLGFVEDPWSRPPATASRLLTVAASQFTWLGPEILYWTLLEGATGASLGKRLLGLRVVTAAPVRRRWLSILVRSLLFVLLTTTLTGVANVVLAWVPSMALWGYLASTSISAVALASTMRRRNGLRGPHELASGTRVVRAPSRLADTSRSDATWEPAREPEPGMPARVGGYDVEGVVARAPARPILVARDRSLGRRVWLVGSAQGERRAERENGVADDPITLRWLERCESPDGTYDVYECPGGGSLAEHAAAQRSPSRPQAFRVFQFDHGATLPRAEHSLSWPEIYRALRALSEELSRAPGGRALEQIWLDHRRSLRVLDVPAGTDAARPLPPLDLLERTAAALLLGGSSGPEGFLRDLPIRAEPVVRRLLRREIGFASFDEARAALAALDGHPQAVTRSVRQRQLAVACVPLAFSLVASLGSLARAPIFESKAWIVHELRAAQGLQAKSVDETKDQEARLVLISDGFSDPDRRLAVVELLRQDQRFLQMLEITRIASERFPDPTPEEVFAARSRLADSPSGVPIWSRRSQVVASSTANFLTLFGLGGAFAAFLLSAPLSYFLTGIRLRRTDGRRASRVRCAARALLVPICVGLVMVPGFLVESVGLSHGAALAALLGLLLTFRNLRASLRDPSRGAFDDFTKTRTVPA